MRLSSAHLALLASTICGLRAATVDLTAANRRPPAHGLPDWTEVGYERGTQPLPSDAQVGTIISAAQLASKYGVVPNDGVDDTSGLERAIEDARDVGTDGKFVLIQLPAGTINLKYTIYLDSNYLILRGAGNDPTNGGTVLEFRPDENTVYDVLEQPGGDMWDEDGMFTAWAYDEPDGSLQSGIRHVTGNATSGWLWPGRSVFRVGSKRIANKFGTPFDLAAPNRQDIFYGSANYHWRNDTKVKGYMVDQRKDIVGFMGTNKIYYDSQNTSYIWGAGQDVWVGAPARYVDYKSWQVQDPTYYRNEYLYQDWFVVTNVGSDDAGSFLLLDHALRFDVYSSSVAGGSPEMEDDITVAKVMPIEFPTHHIGIEDLYITQPMDGMDPADAVHNYGNLAPESAMHGLVFRYARDCWVRNIRTFMTGSHPIATEAARYLQIQDNYFDGAWNKGKGGNGYMRGSRVWDSLYFNNTLRNLRHFTFQWCAMGNVALMQNMTNDMNMHGGWEGFNLLELNLVTVPYSHRSGSCTAHCGAEGGSVEDGTWAPIYWSTGNKASKWSGATGPRTIFYRNYMLKEFEPNAGQTDYLPYFNRDGSLSDIIWQFGWDRGGTEGSRYQHLSLDGGKTMLVDWQGHEQDAFHQSPAVGVNGQVHDSYTSLFLRDLTGAGGVPSFANVSGQAYCLGKTVPKVVGYYMGSAETRNCLPWAPDAADVTAYTHIIYAYASLASDGTLSLTAAQKAQVSTIVQQKLLNPKMKVLLGVGGWGLGVDPTPLLTIATSGAGRTKFGTTARALVGSLSVDGIDLEWAPCVGAKCISATQFATIATTVKSSLGNFTLSLSTPNAFWSLPGLNTVTSNFTRDIEFISVITHQGGDDPSPNFPDTVLDAVALAGHAGMAPNKLLMGIPLYARSTGGTTTSACLSANDLGQGTFPFYAVNSLFSDDGLYEGDILASVNFDDFYGTSAAQLTDGTVFYADTPWSVAKKARASQDNCMGGVSVFSIDQDNQFGMMTEALYWPGGFSPTAEEITDSLNIVGLDSDGYLQLDSWESLTGQLADQFPYIGAVGTYRVLLLSALKIQTQITNRLRLFLTEPELSLDNFQLYITWESKALDYTIANFTGLGRDYWICNSPFGSLSQCPGRIQLDTPFPSPSDTTFDTVTWHLNDHDGFREFLLNGTGIDLDQLQQGSFYVHRDVTSCHLGPVQNPCPPSNPGCQQFRSNATAITSRSDFDHSNSTMVVRRSDLDPYDPPENCRTLWDGIYTVPPSYFVNPVDVINNFTDSSDSVVSFYRDLAAEDEQTVASLAGLLQTTLTSIALGNSTIGNILGYMQEVRLDQLRQEEFDQEHARASIGEVLGNIFLTLLGFVPGVGELTDLVAGGVGAFELLNKAFDIASLTETLAKDSRVLRLLGQGLRTEEDIASAAAQVERGLSDDALATRGQIGKHVDPVNNKHVSCRSSDLGSYALDGADLASSLAPPSPDSKVRRSVWPQHNQARRSLFTPHSTLSALEKRANNKNKPQPTPDKCLFKNSKTGQLRAKNYADTCRDNNENIDVPQAGPPASILQMSFQDCRAPASKFGPSCSCDHLIEISEFLDAFRTRLTGGPTDPILQGTETDVLCTALDNVNVNSRDELARLINGLDPQGKSYGLSENQNLHPLFSPQSVAHPNSLFKPGGIKADVFQFANAQGTSIENLQSDYPTSEQQKLSYDSLENYMQRYDANRASVADRTDEIFRGWHDKLSAAGQTDALAALTKLWDPTPVPNETRGPFRRKIDDNTARFKANLAKIRNGPPAASTSNAGAETVDKTTGKRKELHDVSDEEVDCKKTKLDAAGGSSFAPLRRRVMSPP